MAKPLILPDTSVLIEGLLSKHIGDGSLKPAKVFIHEAAIAELEHQANDGKETGHLGIDEIGRLQSMSAKYGFAVQFVGERPGDFETHTPGFIDSIIRDEAGRLGAVLHTADRVQASVARAKGLEVELHEFLERGRMDIEDFFDLQTMSVHLREDCPVMAKKGKPGEWDLVTVREKVLTQGEVEMYARQIVEAAQTMKDGFLEIERKGSTICQVGPYRVVITRPPFSDGYEITAVRPVKKLTMLEYHLTEKLEARISEHAEGILIAGPPGHGKSTFAQALAEYYAARKKVVKTVEAPRDLILGPNITQYSMSHGSPEEIHDILLLSRPDYTIFDEMRNTDDFKLYADMRLSGVGMIGVMHATAPIDAIQRFLGRIELGVIPHVMDTVIFIKNGAPEHIYSVTMTVKVPSGMTEADLARPIVEVHDFETNRLEFEIYSYGEETVVIPVKSDGMKPTGASKLIQKGVQDYFRKYAPGAQVEMLSANRAQVTVPSGMAGELIGRGGERIKKIEEELGVKIDLKEGDVRGDDDDRRGGKRDWFDDARGRKDKKHKKKGKWR